MNSTSRPFVLWAAILATAALSLTSLSYRFRVESKNRAVELAVESNVAEALGRGEGKSLGRALEVLRSAGVGAIVLSEETIGDLEKTGRLRIYRPTMEEIPTGVVRNRSAGPGPDEHMIAYDSDLGSRIAAGLAARGIRALHAVRNPGSRQPDGSWGPATERIFVSSVSRELLQTVSAGIDVGVSGLARVQEMRVIARASNPLGADLRYARSTLAGLHRAGTDVFLPQGDQVIGRRDGLEDVEKGLIESGMQYASPEFVKIGGDLNLVTKVPGLVVRLHSAQAAELDKMTESDAVERYVRAGRERNIRILLLRPITFTAEKPLEAFAGFVRKVGSRLVREGAAVGPAKPFEAPEVPQWTFPGIGIAAAAVSWQIAAMLFRRRWLVGLIGIGALLAGIAAWLPDFRNHAALLASLSFPIAAYGLFCQKGNVSIPKAFAGITIVSLVGGLAVAGMLNDLPYFIRGDQFTGVKLAHFLPVLAVGVFLASQHVDWRGGLQSPITWLQASLSIVILIGLALMFARTGNDNPAAVSGLELKLRSLLDNVLPVRPRTKEFLMGYPALVVGLGLLAQVRSGAEVGRPLAGWAVLALMVGAIAPTSVVNTMCHLHTPLEVGLIRIAVGFVVGGIIGGAAWFVLRLWLPKPGT
jgi:hypothetical protein